MPSKDDDIFDVSYLFGSIDSIAEAIEAHFDSVSRSLKDTFRSSPWLPDSIKPRPPPSPPRRFPSMPVSYYEASLEWLSEHRAVTAAVIAFIGTGAFIVWRRRRADRAKRRAKRAKNGARTEIVVLAGSVHAPLTRSLSQELERRGFIVYIPVSSLSEEQLVQSESRGDIRPLNMDITSVRVSFKPYLVAVLIDAAALIYSRSYPETCQSYIRSATTHIKRTNPYPPPYSYYSSSWNFSAYSSCRLPSSINMVRCSEYPSTGPFYNTSSFPSTSYLPEIYNFIPHPLDSTVTHTSLPRRG